MELSAHAGIRCAPPGHRAAGFPRPCLFRLPPTQRRPFLMVVMEVKQPTASQSDAIQPPGARFTRAHPFLRSLLQRSDHQQGCGPICRPVLQLPYLEGAQNPARRNKHRMAGRLDARTGSGMAGKKRPGGAHTCVIPHSRSMICERMTISRCSRSFSSPSRNPFHQSGSRASTMTSTMTISSRSLSLSFSHSPRAGARV